MHGIIEIVVKKLSISKPKDHQVASSWNCGVQIVQKPENIGLELSLTCHTVEGFGTDIIADQL